MKFAQRGLSLALWEGDGVRRDFIPLCGSPRPMIVNR